MTFPRAIFCCPRFSSQGPSKNICAFCGCALQPSQTEKLKELLTKGDRVHPNCGKQSCLKLHPKANVKDGWTVKKKQQRKRRGLDQKKPAKRRKKAKSKPRPKPTIPAKPKLRQKKNLQPK